mgnify:CR=1 FL=1
MGGHGTAVTAVPLAGEQQPPAAGGPQDGDRLLKQSAEDPLPAAGRTDTGADLRGVGGWHEDGQRTHRPAPVQSLEVAGHLGADVKGMVRIFQPVEAVWSRPCSDGADFHEGHLTFTMDGCKNQYTTQGGRITIERTERLGRYTLVQTADCFPLGGDSLALAAFASVRRGDRVCDLGCGAGALLLLLAARVSPLVLSGVEYCPEDAALAHQNLAENGLEGAIYTGDLRAVCKTLPAGGFSVAISNPPYFKAGSGGCGGPARMEGDCALEDWCAAAGRLLKNGGRFALVHRPERLCDLFAALRSAGLEPKRLLTVQGAAASAPWLLLLEAKKGGKPGLRWEPPWLQDQPAHRQEIYGRNIS